MSETCTQMLLSTLLTEPHDYLLCIIINWQGYLGRGDWLLS